MLLLRWNLICLSLKSLYFDSILLLVLQKIDPIFYSKKYSTLPSTRQPLIFLCINSFHNSVELVPLIFKKENENEWEKLLLQPLLFKIRRKFWTLSCPWNERKKWKKERRKKQLNDYFHAIVRLFLFCDIILLETTSSSTEQQPYCTSIQVVIKL